MTAAALGNGAARSVLLHLQILVTPRRARTV
jgi:hypothetical protein